MTNSNKKSRIIAALRKLYPYPKSELAFRNRYQMTVAVILSAQCTDKKVNQITPLLFSRFPSFAALAAASISQVEKIIRPINYYKTKSRSLIALAQIITEQYSGRLPLLFESLIELPGIGRKTANVILAETGIFALPVDTHVFRVAKRLGWAKAATPEKVELELQALFERKLWRNLHHWLILHGRRVCKAQRPLCPQCSLARYCPSAKTRRL